MVIWNSFDIDSGFLVRAQANMLRVGEGVVAGS
jgi:hypothetical protein